MLTLMTGITNLHNDSIFSFSVSGRFVSMRLCFSYLSPDRTVIPGVMQQV